MNLETWSSTLSLGSSKNLEPGTLNLEPNYQVIFATSMIAPELEREEYTRGEFYTQTNKSLKNV